ncbi:MAG TPA: hypothetical protein VFF89_04365 [Sphingobium sp.]|nr:hypothetical protein [Sphingobium sp.]
MGAVPTGRVHYWLPTADGGRWRFDVAMPLARCIGRYARIPEFARDSHLLVRIAGPGASKG